MFYNIKYVVQHKNPDPLPKVFYYFCRIKSQARDDARSFIPAGTLKQ